VKLSRRDFFGIAGGAGLVAATASLGLVKLGPSASTGALLPSAVPLPLPFSRWLTLPPTAVPDTATAAGEQYTLVQRAAQADIIPGLPTTIWGYNGTFPGPTIRARTGRPIGVLVRNDLQVGTVVHLHGGRTPPESDGYPTDLILPRSGSVHAGMQMAGATTVGERTYDYPLEQRAATLWYHDHAMDFTGPHVYRGLAGHPRVTVERIPNGTNLTRLTLRTDPAVMTRRLADTGIQMPTPAANGTVLLGVNETWARRSESEMLQAFTQALS